MSGYAPDDLEREVLALWEREGTFAESLVRRKDAPRYAFYDGPPYATGSPHYGHILQTAIKDAVTRYWTMRGYRVDRRVGWDCHGLPIENLVEKELGITNKKEIEERGVEAFNAACRQTVLRNVGEWTSLLRRVGRWADYARAYATMDAPFMESAWWVFKTAWDRGMVYKGMRSSPYCPRCETSLSNFETAQGYREVSDPAVTVKLRLVGEPNTFLLIWTTTPWTLPANAAVAVRADLQYVRVRAGDERWILAKGRVADIIGADHPIEEEFAGSSLVGRTYEPLYSFIAPEKPAYRVVAGDFVSAEEGTGLVHIAPAFGEDDFRLAEIEGLPMFHTVDERGRFLPRVTFWAGQPVKEADQAIIAELESRKLIAQSGTIRHEYPHCWRCETPLLYMATTSWFIAVTKIKEQLRKNAEQINWIPGHLKAGRFGQGLRDAPDWAVSRSRFWGIPLPVWECRSCEQYTVVGSVQELEQLGSNLSVLKSPHADPDLHRPYVDRVVLQCTHCGGEAKRVSEVLDVWFDSGSMPYGQWHYPFENKELVEETFPADFIGEALEQTRGWFYTLHVLAGILTQQDLGLGENQPAFRNAVATGLVLAEDGRKLSKSLQNYPNPSGLVAKYGADSVRLCLLSTTKLGEDTRFSDRLVGELYRRFTLILWNVWSYYETYASPRHSSASPKNLGVTETAVPRFAQDDKQLALLDRWVLARTAQLVAEVRAAMDAYHLDDAARALLPFIDDVSTWYVRRSRGRAEALPVLREVLRVFSLVAAPFIPFLAERIHRELTGCSPHLADWPEVQAGGPGTKLGTGQGSGHEAGGNVFEQMRVIREFASAGLRARAEANIKLRQPLTEAVIVGDFPALAAAGEEGLALLRDELNVKGIRVLQASEVSRAQPRKITWVEAAGGTLGLNTALTDELMQEGMIRDLIRFAQNLRKRAGYRLDDEIILSVVTDSATVQAVVERFGDLLKAETNSRALQFESGDADASGGVVLGGSAARIGVRK